MLAATPPRSSPLPAALIAARLDEGVRAAVHSEAETAVADAAAMQERLIKVMEEILEHMVRWEDYQQAVTLLQEVLKTQAEIKAETVEEQKRRIESIFD